MLSVLRQGMRPREPRIRVLLPSRMRVGSTWVDAHIHNISSRGLLVASDEAPAPGTYMEIRRGRTVIVGRAVWAKGRMFGVRTQDRIDLAALQAEPTRGAGGRADERRDARHRDDPVRRDAAMARTLERNRAMSHFLQFGLIVFASVAACGLAASAVYGVLEGPLASVRQAMGGDKEPLD